MSTTPRRIFVSHAAADSALVNEFVDTVLKLGTDVRREELFYTSGAATGIPSGENLNSYIKKNLVDAGLVIAVITPAFRTRPYCLAELGAAWSRTGNLFPLAAPGIVGNDLDGVLTGLMVRNLDDPNALDELHDRVVDIIGRRPGVATWGRYKSQFLANIVRPVGRPSHPSTPPGPPPGPSPRRSIPRLNKLIDADVLTEGETLSIVVPPKIVKVDTAAVEAWLREDTQRREVRWRNDPTAPVEWVVEASTWTLDGLIKEIVRRATGKQDAGVWGFAWLQTGEGRTLAKIVGDLPRPAAG